MTSALFKQCLMWIVSGMALCYMINAAISLKIGEIHTLNKFGSVYSRAADPQLFWFHVIMHFVIGAICVAGVIVLMF